MRIESLLLRIEGSEQFCKQANQVIGLLGPKDTEEVAQLSATQRQQVDVGLTNLAKSASTADEFAQYLFLAKQLDLLGLVDDTGLLNPWADWRSWTQSLSAGSVPVTVTELPAPQPTARQLAVTKILPDGFLAQPGSVLFDEDRDFRVVAHRGDPLSGFEVVEFQGWVTQQGEASLYSQLPLGKAASSAELERLARGAQEAFLTGLAERNAHYLQDVRAKYPSIFEKEHWANVTLHAGQLPPEERVSMALLGKVLIPSEMAKQANFKDLDRDGDSRNWTEHLRPEGRPTYVTYWYRRESGDQVWGVGLLTGGEDPASWRVQVPQEARGQEVFFEFGVDIRDGSNSYFLQSTERVRVPLT